MPTITCLVSLDVHEISNYFKRLGGSGACLAGITIDTTICWCIVLIPDFTGWNTKQLNHALNNLAWTDPSVNHGITKLMVFNTIQAWGIWEPNVMINQWPHLEWPLVTALTWIISGDPPGFLIWVKSWNWLIHTNDHEEPHPKDKIRYCLNTYKHIPDNNSTLFVLV